MPSFERGGSIPLFQMMGSWQSTRAANPSDGMDPRSLGLVPSVGGHPESIPNAGTLPPDVMPMETPTEEPIPTPQPTPGQELYNPELGGASSTPSFPVRNMVLLDDGVACIDGEWLPLTYEAHLAIANAVVDSYAAAISGRLAILRERYGLHQAKGQDPLRLSDEEAALVFGLPGAPAPVEPAEPGPPATQDLQPLPEPATQEDALRSMPRNKARGRTPASHARPAVPHSTTGDEA